MTIQDDSGTHATLADSESASDHQELPRGFNLGRYVIIEPIGSGGMGTVYRAYDPQLNRGVALKILSVKHADFQEAERAKARLIREAQALAQLSHPNVVAVHDADAFGDDVFIAMELVEGQTLDKWMRQKSRSPKEVVEVMTAAGRGLSAAHRVGLVHRDFKPGNIIVGDDGRVRVLDFGLARAASQQEALGEIEKGEQSQEQKISVDFKEISSESSPNLLLSPLTHAGGILGTPLYMAPEQHLGLKTDERTDQFGFCIVLYEALYGKRPFAAKSMEELKSEVIRRNVIVPRPDSSVPTWLWKIIYRGLSVRSEDRYPTMDLLLADLDKDPEEARRQKQLARRRKLVVASLILLTITLPIVVWYGLRYRTFQLCKNAEEEFVGLWDEATKASVQKAFLATKKTYAQGTWERVNRTIDRYLAGWLLMRRDVCEARLIRGTQSEKLFDLRMSCLRKRIGELRALGRVFTQADAEVVQKAVQASASLTSIAICADEDALHAAYLPPKTEEEKALVASIREKLADVVAFTETGKYKKGLELASMLEREANAVDYLPVQAEVLYHLGKLLSRTAGYEQARETLHTAALKAGQSKNALLAAQAIVMLVRVVGVRLAQHKDGLLLAKEAQLLLGLYGEDARVRSKLLLYMGQVLHRQGDFDRALAFYRNALSIDDKALGSNHPRVAASMNEIGIVLNDKAEYKKSLKYHQKALTIWQNVLGPQHPQVAVSLNNLGLVSWNDGQYEKALEYSERALDTRNKALGLHHPAVADTLNNLGIMYSNQNKNNKALTAYRRALAIRQKALGPEHPLVAETINNMASVFTELADYHKASECYLKSLAIYEKALGPNNPDVAYPLINLGDIFRKQGQYQKAYTYLQKAYLIWEKSLGPEHPMVALSLNLIGKSLVGQRKLHKAIESFDRAAAICKKKTCEPDSYANGLFDLARILWSTNTDRKRSINLAKQAVSLFEKTPKTFERKLKEVHAWLQARR